MRLGVVTTSYPRHDGDPAGHFVAGMARWLRRRGHAVEVIAAGPGAANDGDIAVARVAAGAGLFYDEGAPERLGRSWRARLRAPVFAAALTGRVLAASRRWDAVISHWLVPSSMTAALTRRPHLAVAHSGDVHLLARRGLGDAAITALLAGGPVRVAFTSEHLRARLGAHLSAPLAGALAARSFVCPMGLETDSFAHLRPVQPDPPVGAPLIAFIGRLVPIKGVRHLIDACARIGRCQLVIGGDGPERGALERQGQGLVDRHPGLKVRFAGEVAGAGKDALLAAADVLVVPSVNLDGGRTEGMPVTALEALAAGVPLVASDVGGVRSTIGERAARLVTPGDALALAAALSETLGDWPATAARVRAGRTIAADYDWNRVGERLVASLTSARA
jgi:glycosyltransferase involved in cell wall biosynthesis